MKKVIYQGDDSNYLQFNDSTGQPGYWTGGKRPFLNPFQQDPNANPQEIVKNHWTPPPQEDTKPAVQNPVFDLYIKNYLICIQMFLEKFQDVGSMERQLNRRDLDSVCRFERNHLRDIVNTRGWDSYDAWKVVQPFDIPPMPKWEFEERTKMKGKDDNF